MTLQSKYSCVTLKTFVESIKAKTQTTSNRLIITLDSKIYPNQFGISVRPLRAQIGSDIFKMKELIEIFGKIPYITVKESRYRTVYREPMIMTVNLTPKTFTPNPLTTGESNDQRTYYEYYIDKLCLRSELKQYESIYSKAHEVIKEYKKMNCEIESIDDYVSIPKGIRSKALGTESVETGEPIS